MVNRARGSGATFALGGFPPGAEYSIGLHSAPKWQQLSRELSVLEHAEAPTKRTSAGALIRG
jgi:hypothetical protein